MNKELLIPLDAYYKIEHQIPYNYTIEIKGQVIYYFGSKHSFDPENPQFESIRKFFNDFLSHTTKENSIVLVEGGERPVASSEKRSN